MTLIIAIIIAALIGFISGGLAMARDKRLNEEMQAKSKAAAKAYLDEYYRVNYGVVRCGNGFRCIKTGRFVSIKY